MALERFSSLNMADLSDSMKKFGAQTATFFTRAKQYTEEQLGKTEKTEFDARFDSLLERADHTKQWTEKLLKHTEAVLQPNPGVRLEEFMYNKLEKQKPPRMTNNEALGHIMIDAGNDYGPGTSYGSALVKCGYMQKKVGQAEREFMTKSSSHFLHPLRSFLEGDMKTIGKEKRALLAKRLDLDACKARVRKSQSPERMQQMYSSRNNMLLASELDKAEADLRVAQAEFDRQYEVTKLLLDGINTAHANHLRALQSFVEAQAQHFAQCHSYMQDLQKQLASPPGEVTPPVAPPAVPSDAAGGVDINSYPRPAVTRKAKVLYDYDASEKNELSLLADEIITVYSLPGMDSDWIVGERGSQRGKVPLTYVELLN